MASSCRNLMQVSRHLSPTSLTGLAKLSVNIKMTLYKESCQLLIEKIDVFLSISKFTSQYQREKYRASPYFAFAGAVTGLCTLIIGAFRYRRQIIRNRTLAGISGICCQVFANVIWIGYCRLQIFILPCTFKGFTSSLYIMDFSALQ